MPLSDLTFKKKRRWPKWRILLLLAAFVAGGFFIRPWFSSKSGRGLAGFSSVEMEYAESLWEDTEEHDPNLNIAPPYQDDLEIPSYDYSNKAEAFLERSQMMEYRKALSRELSSARAKRFKNALARRIIERNRKLGYEIVLDEDFNVVSFQEISRPQTAEEKQAPENADSRLASSPSGN